MNVLDIIIAIPVIWFAYKGFSHGLIKEAGSLAALILGIYGAMKLSCYTQQYIAGFESVSAQYIPVISFAITFIAIIVGITLLSRLLDRFVNAIKLDWLNKLGGVVFGALKAGFIISGLIFIINQFNANDRWFNSDYAGSSLLYPYVEKLVPAVCPYIPETDLTLGISGDEAN